MDPITATFSISDLLSGVKLMLRSQDCITLDTSYINTELHEDIQAESLIPLDEFYSIQVPYYIE